MSLVVYKKTNQVKRKAPYHSRTPRAKMYKQVQTPYVTKAGARTANKVNRMLASTVGSHAIETKTVDNNLMPGIFEPIIHTYNTNGCAMLLNNVQEGTADFQRVGKRINMKSIRIRGEVAIGSYSQSVSGSGVNSLNVRMVLVYFREYHSAIPDWNAVFGTLSPTGTTTGNLYSPLQSANMGSVAVMMDRVYSNDLKGMALPSNTDITINVPFDEFIDLGGIGATYSGTASPITIANITGGALVLYARANFNSALPGEGQASIYQESHARLRFTDV